jgi:hypothetical protein
LKIALVVQVVDRRVGRVAAGEVVRELEPADARLDLLRWVPVRWHRFLSLDRDCRACQQRAIQVQPGLRRPAAKSLLDGWGSSHLHWRQLKLPRLSNR